MTSVVSVALLIMFSIGAVKVAYREGKRDGFIEGVCWQQRKNRSSNT